MLPTHSERHAAHEHVESVLKRIDVSTFPIKTALSAELTSSHPYEVTLVVRLEVTPRPKDATLGVLPGDTMCVKFRKGLLITELHDEDRTIAFIRDKVREALHHELDEHFMVDGERRFDPHQREYQFHGQEETQPPQEPDAAGHRQGGS